MSKYREERVTLWQSLSEGLKMVAIVAIFGLVFAGIGIAGCKHDSCSAPETWKQVIEFFGRPFGGE